MLPEVLTAAKPLAPMDTTSSSESTPNLTSSSEARIRRLSAYIAAIFLGALFGLTLVMVFVRQFGPGQLPELSGEEFREARERWSQAGVADYQIEIVVRGRETATYAVQVRDGVIQSASRDGQPLKQQRTWGTWSVPGMFETIERDVSTVELHRQGEADPNTPQLLLRGVFDQELGFPRRYQRTEVQRFGANHEVSWEVTRFERLSKSPSVS